MNTINIFPLHIITKQLSDDIADRAEQIFLQNYDVLNVEDHLTDYGSGQIDYSKLFREIIQELANILFSYNTTLQMSLFEKYFKKIHKSDLDIHMWIQDYKKGHQHEVHMHPACAISGVYYLRGDDESEKLNFVNPNVSQSMFTSEPSDLLYRLSVRKGMAVLFPSYLCHYVKSSTNTNIRTSLAFNMYKRESRATRALRRSPRNETGSNAWSVTFQGPRLPPTSGWR
jgi:uncharacterized protein (TIGR02466 family)